jgi:hypothetical protein
LENVYKNANTLAHGDAHLVVLAHLHKGWKKEEIGVSGYDRMVAPEWPDASGG